MSILKHEHMIKVLSLPARHPYMSKFHQSGEIEFVNPDTDYFNKCGGEATREFIEKAHPRNTYDIVHIHFSFDKLNVIELTRLFDYFDSINKPVVWTCHSRESQREKNIGEGELQKILYKRSKAIITLTDGCRSWLIATYGDKKKIDVIPLGYIANPENLFLFTEKLKRKANTKFIFLVSEMRKNKEVNQSIINFLQCSALDRCSLTTIIKPISYYKDTFETLDESMINFWNITQHSERINIISLPEISNELLTELFCESHVCLLPYLWGTHSGQVELSRDCGCYPVVSNVGFYGEQSDQVIEFQYDENPKLFASNFTQALIKAQGMPLLTPNPEFRKIEFKMILRKHIDFYKTVLKS